jgi:hypothetical protein
MDPEDDKLLEAVGAAVDAATPADVLEPKDDDDTSSSDAAAAAGAADDDKGADGDKTKAKDGEDSTAPDPAADRGDGRNAKGEFVKKQGETDADFEKRKAAPAAKGAADPKGELDPKTGKPKVAPAAKKADPVNDPIPDDVKGKTRERMVGLVTVAKTLTQERDTARASLKAFDDAIKETGADPDTFANHMTLLGAMLSTDPAQQREAIKLLRHQADRIAEDLGDTPAGKDPLEGHQDLIDAVEDGDMSKKHAIELAERRNREKASETRKTKQTAAESEAAEFNTAVDAAREDLNEYGAQLAEKDPLFKTKAAILLPAVQAMAQSTHPSKWLDAYKKMYANLKIAPRAAVGGGQDTRQRVAAGTGDRQPSRPRQGAGGGAKPAPTSLEAAIDFGLDAERASRAR